jgi:hypothetical protein
MAARTPKTADRPKFIVSEPDERRASLINFRGAAEGVRPFSNRPSPFRPFWGQQNGHFCKNGTDRFVEWLNRSAKSELLVLEEEYGDRFGIDFTPLLWSLSNRLI